MRVLVVEDEASLAGQITVALQEAGLTVDHADNGEDGWHLGATESFDCVVLDLGLPIMDGVSVLRKWREEGMSVPVLILTARGRWQDRVAGLNAGGDDYLAKPFHMEELVARLRALIRRNAGNSDSILKAGDVELDTVSSTVTVAGRAVKLTAKEYQLLMALMMRPTEVQKKTDLAEMLYGYYVDRDSNTIEVFVRRLRKKLGDDLIETVRGLGYRIGSV